MVQSHWPWNYNKGAPALPSLAFFKLSATILVANNGTGGQGDRSPLVARDERFQFVALSCRLPADRRPVCVEGVDSLPGRQHLLAQALQVRRYHEVHSSDVLPRIRVRDFFFTLILMTIDDSLLCFGFKTS